MEDSPSTWGVLKVKERSPNTCDEVAVVAEEEDELVVVVVAAFVVVAVFFEAAGDAEAEAVDEAEAAVDFVVSLIVLLRTWQLLDELDELLWVVKLLPGGRERVLLLSSVSTRRQQRIS